ncbi:glycosyltransferase WbuB [Polynucleobacter sphagniphilus]|jgi:colanic acid biosynthesis glycosyl transferase WcaI|uniref:Colanic acid biosynthesis glycosyl transferase WcaI n=1 Tax=Polynucleobacter sphagniphilus TaxID=1743169 RepID=A0AA43MAM5_9BURK|nr:glycosyltransferase WbuB [Polynucleobacter sphagniphilus]MDH6504725.1 colanic acid biosynthesis glycosyl transferase WcaI [Polynucleobacter sphagniphilus]MDH6513459.1 colanic acid biosynthesis glycosyl transferase WcaI [Polynucleobacter sphagniphilus]
MRILIQSLNFYPELTGIGKYSGEMAAYLASRGHQVHVITAPPYYPAWKISPEYKKYFWSKERWRNVLVLRCPIWVPEKPSGLTRILHLASFALSSLPIALFQALWRPDIIVTIEPPLFTAPAALLSAGLCGAKTVLHIQDYEVDAAFDLGLLRGQFLKKLVINIEKLLLKQFDLVSTISNRMVDRALCKGISAEKVYLFPNWADTLALPKNESQSKEALVDTKTAYRNKLGIPQDAIVILYSGNMGAKQGLEILSEVARKFQQREAALTPIHFIFCGEGVSRKALEQQCDQLKFVQFLDLQPSESLGEFLAMADIHLLPQRADAADLVMPSKLTGMLASGRPVLACANAGTELANVVQHCGLVVPPEDPEAFYEALSKLIADSQLRQALGLAGAEYALNHLSQDRILSNFESKLIQLRNAG